MSKQSSEQALCEIETALVVAEDYADFRSRVEEIIARWRSEQDASWSACAAPTSGCTNAEQVCRSPSLISSRRREVADSERLQDTRTGAELIADERKRQVTQEGWSPEHDDEHVKGELVWAARAYAVLYNMPFKMSQGTADQVGWPWDVESFKHDPVDPIRNLAKAGALIAAEIDRLKRAEWEQHIANVEANRG